MYYAMVRALSFLNSQITNDIIDKLTDNDIKELANARKNVG